ncbi:MAG TPA: ABC transporter substrate-binding protein [Cyanobacteria bacterium UBA8156]|nr:ABC transporter substrate-binding protein [Cyanobacteria bacterium UBA8156]
MNRYLSWSRLQGFALWVVISLVMAMTTGVVSPIEPGLSQPRSAQRVVALTSLSADILSRLDRQKLVGVPGGALMANNPRLQGIPTISAGRTQPNLERIVALKPDLAIGAKNFHEQTAQRLNQLKIPTLLLETRTWEDLEAQTRQLAQIVGANPQALLAQYQQLRRDRPAGVSALVLASRQPILTPNRNSWAGSMLARFGLQNAAAELQGSSPFQGYVSISPERLLQTNPDVLLVVETGDRLQEQLSREPFWQRLKAVQTKQVYGFDYHGLVNPGSVEAIAKAAAELQKIAAR